ncbi:hypothetical protein [Streptomyces melanosporofaciens]|uniref:hypothetical protein n=1 Tax=Streptomyces melanosporofaciens TaxID=67327 RepID=UPI00115FA058|nr:hypothetical protein [Streptomyces melanosporofaciens]
MPKEASRSSEKAPSARDTQVAADAMTAEAASGTGDGAETARSGKESPAGEGAGLPKQQSAAQAADSETGGSTRT